MKKDAPWCPKDDRLYLSSDDLLEILVGILRGSLTSTSLCSTFALPSPSVNNLSLFCRLRAHGKMTATNIVMSSTPTRTPPMPGARGSLPPPSPEPLCTRFVGEGGVIEEPDEVDED